jgi:hypothetical protein
MPIKKLIRDLKVTLKKEKETKHLTRLGKWWGNWKIRSIEARIKNLEWELKERKRNG